MRRAESVFYCAFGRFDAGGGADIGGDCDGTAAPLGDEVGGVLELVCATGDKGELGAGLREAEGGFPAQAPAGAGDQSDASVERGRHGGSFRKISGIRGDLIVR